MNLLLEGSGRSECFGEVRSEVSVMIRSQWDQANDIAEEVLLEVPLRIRLELGAPVL